MPLYNNRTPSADMSTLQRNSSFTLRSLPTESTSAVNTTSVSFTPSPLADPVHPLLERPDSCHFLVGLLGNNELLSS
ncbi:hypothetical protein CHARACLAT_022664 [Characodon lateralis]|uniref:Uncharacterized protein n=1 Tax=Characodon lateralis TaxID=208331 RepID=A0ABU7F5V5_9TELE|nr:hypothetical protein [Characodon lateralis]